MTTHTTETPQDSRIALLESIHSSAERVLRDRRLSVETRPGALEGAELRELLAGVDAVGVRSRTTLSAADLAATKRLLAIGCFSVGTNNVDLAAATRLGLPVFNAPHASTRSVAELALGLVLALARGIVQRSRAAADGAWEKSATGAHEVRGRTLGIIGYGHVGSQVSVLAEALGMHVVFHDIRDVQPLGNARACTSLAALLRDADFVTLHVPGGDGTRGLLGREQLALMKAGAFLLNTSRGSVVDEAALREALDSGHLAGAALDVLQREPASRDQPLENPLAQHPNVVVTPHVGGSTEEAQHRIGEQVARRLARFVLEGSTRGAVNVPHVELARTEGTHRLTHFHHNVPGVLSEVNGLLGRLGVTVAAQVLRTHGDLGYLVVDVDQDVSREALAALAELDTTIRARLLF